MSFTATSQRLTKIDATEPTFGSSPAAIRRSMPRIYASAAARYCSRENSSVTFTGTPAKIDSSIAGTPSGVPGILMNRLGRCARRCSCATASMVPAVSFASKGETSSDTQPSTPPVRVVDRTEQVGGLDQILERKLEKQRLARFALAVFCRIAAS